MEIKSVFRLITSLLTTLGINFIPLNIWINQNSSGATVMILYCIENVILIILTALFIRFLAPQYELDKEKKVIIRKDRINSFLIITVPFSFTALIVILFFLFMKMPKVSAIYLGALGIIVCQLLSFLFNFIFLRPLSLVKAEDILYNTSRRVLLLFFVVFIGIILAAFSFSWFIIPFIIVKILADLEGVFLLFTGRKKTKVHLNQVSVTINNKIKFLK